MPRRPCSIHRVLLALIVSGLLLPLPLGAPSAVADHVPTHEPAARLQLVVNSVYIIHDNDPIGFGSGEITITSVVMRCVHYHLGQCDQPTNLATDTYGPFSADDKETVTLNRVVPATGYFDVYDGGEYMLRIMGLESDSTSADDYMGEWVWPLLKEENWHIGQHEYWSWGEYYDNGTRRHQGDFTVNYEIRAAPLPDLHPTQIKVLNLAGTTDETVCVALENIGTGDAGPFEVTLRVNDVLVPNTQMNAGKLAAGLSGELCTPLNLTQSARLVAIVDEAHAVTEFNETNNWVDFGYVAPQPVADPGTGSSSSGQSDLVAKRIQVQGKEPSGQNDCDPGKNDVTVTVTNEGAAVTGAFVVRLLVDDEDDDVSLRTVTSLDAGKETTVEFGGVQLKKGERKLTATADAQKQVTESKEDNNELKVNVRCKKEGEDDD